MIIGLKYKIFLGKMISGLKCKNTNDNPNTIDGNL